MTNFSYSQALLAGAIAYLAFSLVKVSEELPAIIAVINETTLLVDKISPQLPAIVEEVAKVREVVDQQVPIIINEITLVRLMLDKQLPPLLEQVDLIRPVISDITTVSNRYEKQIPAILKRVDSSLKTTNKTTIELSKWRSHSSQYINQIKNSREDIPVYLTRIEHIVEDANNVGKEASSGMVVGLFKGVASLPFSMLTGVKGIVDSSSESAKYLNEEDITLIKEQSIILLEASLVKETKWKNPHSNSYGTIKKGELFEQDNMKCHSLIFHNYFKAESKNKNETQISIMCLDDEDVWQIVD